MEGIVNNPQRIEKPSCKFVDLNFKVTGPAPYTHMDVKHPVGSEILRKQNPNVDIKTMAYKMGKKIVNQKDLRLGFIGLATQNSELLELKKN